MSQSSILIYGHDQRLLETRSWVLELAGYRVVQAKDLAEAEARATEETLDVAVICHTLNAEECREALALVRRLRPEARRLVMTAGWTRVSDGQQEAVVSGYDGPGRLLQEVGRLVRGRNTPE